jgi:hypothetical protein
MMVWPTLGNTLLYWLLATATIFLLGGVTGACAQTEQVIDANYSLEELVVLVVTGCGLLNVVSININ